MEHIGTYKEVQHINDIALYALIGLSITGTVYGAIMAIIETWSVGEAIFFLAIASVLMGCLWLMAKLKMKLSINERRIKFKISPFHRKAQKIAWSEVERMEIVKTPWLAHWMGANISFGNEQRFSLSGRNGLSITTKDGKNYFIGSKNPERMAKKIATLRSEA